MTPRRSPQGKIEQQLAKCLRITSLPAAVSGLCAQPVERVACYFGKAVI